MTVKWHFGSNPKNSLSVSSDDIDIVIHNWMLITFYENHAIVSGFFFFFFFTTIVTLHLFFKLLVEALYRHYAKGFRTREKIIKFAPQISISGV